MKHYLQSYRKNPNKMSGGQKAIVAGVGVAGVVGIGYYLAQTLAATNGSCTTKGSACNSALSPYETQFKSCWTTYMTLLNQYVAEDAKAGTGISAAQKSALAPYLSCSNTAASNIGKIAHSYGENPIIVIGTFITEAVIAYFIIKYGIRAAIYYNTYMKGLKSPAAAQSGVTDAAINDAVDTGILNPADASGLTTSAQDTGSSATTETSNFYSDMAEEDIITTEEATAETEAETTIISDDLDELTGLLE